MLIERFFEQATGRRACADAGRRLLEETSHLVKARSVAVAAGLCVFQARLGETMGVRGFYHSVLPGKGQLLHLILALSFPRAFEESRGGGVVDYQELAEQAFYWLEGEGLVDEEKREPEKRREIVKTAEEMLRGGITFVEEAFRRLLGGDPSESLSRARVIVEPHLMSYRLHIWGVPDIIVEDPRERIAAVIEWKTYRPKEGRTPTVDDVDVAQAYVYAMLEAERLGYVDHLAGGFEDYVSAVLGSPPEGRGARIIPGIVRPAYRASAIVARHPLYCEATSDPAKCSFGRLRSLLAKLVLAAEHLTLSVTSTRKLGENARTIEGLCSVRGRDGKPRPVFRRVPRLQLDGEQVNLPMHNPLRVDEKGRPRWPCNICPDNVREACIYYLQGGGDTDYGDVEDVIRRIRMEAWREAWRARFAIYENRENALAPYKQLRSLALSFGSDFSWVRGSLDARILDDGSRLDLFDEAYVDGYEIVLVRPVLEWERSTGHLVTLREGKPAAVFLNEGWIRDPLLRVGFHGSVSSVSVEKDDEGKARVVVRIAPANKLSRIYPVILERLQGREPELFRNVVALEVNVDLTQLELYGVTAAEMGTVKKAVEAAKKARKGEDVEAEEMLALLFSGVKLEA